MLSRICLPIFGGVDRISSRWGHKWKMRHMTEICLSWYPIQDTKQCIIRTCKILLLTVFSNHCWWRATITTRPFCDKGAQLIRSRLLMSGFCSLITGALSLIVWSMNYNDIDALDDNQCTLCHPPLITNDLSLSWLFDLCTWKLRQCICITCVVMMTSEYDGKDNCRRYFMLFQAVATEINQRSATVVVFQLISCKFPKVFPPNGGICPKCCPIVSRLWELPLLLLYWRPIDSLSRRSPNLRLICIKRSLNSH